MVSAFSRADVKLQILLKCVLYVLSYILILVSLSSKREKLDNMPRKEYDVRKIIKNIQIKQERTPQLHICIFSVLN